MLLSVFGALAGLDLTLVAVWFFVEGAPFVAAFSFNSSAAAASVAVSLAFVGAGLVAAGAVATAAVLALAGGGSVGGAVMLPGGVLEDSVGDTVSTLTACPEELLSPEDAVATVDVVPP